MDTSVHEESEASLSDFVIEFVKPYASEMFSLVRKQFIFFLLSVLSGNL